MGSLVHKNRYFRRQNHCTRLNDQPGKGNFIFSRAALVLFLFFLRFSLPVRSHPFPRPPPRTLPSALLLFLTFLFTAANNSFCDVISLRLCSFADTPVLYSIPRDSYGSSVPCMRATFPFFSQSFSLHFSLSLSLLLAYIFSYHPGTAYSLPWHEDRKRSASRDSSDIQLHRWKLNDLSYKRL